jgi:hypothetical protein
MSNVAERRMQLLNLVQAVLPALVEQLIQPEAPKPVVEHCVVTYAWPELDRPGQAPEAAMITPPTPDGDWKLSAVDLAANRAHWFRTVLVEATDTISSPPPDQEGNPPDEQETLTSSAQPSVPPAAEAPLVPCNECHQMPHSSSCVYFAQP